tara:strand:- start:1210 stop:1554 length:345 start_codon:yes stop_codon:yes gene_type:complete
METFIMGDNLQVDLSLSLSTEALPGIHIKLKDKIIKKSNLYDLKVPLGNSDDLEDNKLIVVINCFIDEHIDVIMENAVAKLSITDGTNTKLFTARKLKVENEMFIICFYVILKK